MNRILTVLILLGVAASALSADTIIDTFGPGDAYTVNSGWFIPSPVAGVDAIGMAFTPTVNSVLTKLELALFQNTDSTALVSIMEDSSGVPGGAVLASWTTGDSDNVGPVTLLPVGVVDLTGGDQYWVTVEVDPTPGATTNARWDWGPVPSSGLAFRIPDAGGWEFGVQNAVSAFRISADAADSGVPEPSTLILGAFAFALLAGGKARLRSMKMQKSTTL